MEYNPESVERSRKLLMGIADAAGMRGVALEAFEGLVEDFEASVRWDESQKVYNEIFEEE